MLLSNSLLKWQTSPHFLLVFSYTVQTTHKHSKHLMSSNIQCLSRHCSPATAVRPLTAQGSHYISSKRNHGYGLVLFLPLKTQLALFIAATSISCLTAHTQTFHSTVMPSLPSKSVRLKRGEGKDTNMDITVAVR